MLKIAICDDCADFLLQLEPKIEQWSVGNRSVYVRSFSDGDSLIRAHSIAPFDIILLDVVMPLLNGIETAREIREHDRNVKLVFLTSSPEYAVESYTVKANNYLLKPVDLHALSLCLDELLADMSKSARTITIRISGASRRLRVEDIEYVEAQNKHTFFVMSDGTHFESIDPLHFHEGMLSFSDGFFKCHRSYIVNINHIELYTQSEIRLRSGANIPISRSCHREFQDAYFSTVFRKAGEGND